MFVRVGREAPFDYDVCEHFLESLTMQELVEKMQDGEDVTYETADSVKQNILKNAKVIVSTLNYSANNILVSIKKQKTVKFIIIDEGQVSLYLILNMFLILVVQLVKALKLIVSYLFISVVLRSYLLVILSNFLHAF